MNQEEIGKFIAELRKEKGLTQASFAEILGVNSKTVSKWECGRGMPDVATIPEICKELGISINELLAAERLSPESYSEKSEENIIALMKESGVFNKGNVISRMVIPIVAIIVAAIMIVLVCGGGMAIFSSVVDMLPISVIVIITLLFLIGTKSIITFGKAVGYSFGVGKPQIVQLKNALSVVNFTAKILLSAGIFVTVVSLVVILTQHGVEFDVVLPNISVACSGIFCGLVGYLLLLPMRYGLEVRINESNK